MCVCVCVCVCSVPLCVSDHSLTHPDSLFVSSVLGNSCSFWTGTQAGLRWLTCKGVSFQSLSCLTVVLTGTVILFCLAERFYPKGMPSSLPLCVFSCSAEGFYSRGMSSSLPLSVFCSKQGFYPRGLSLSLPLSVFSCLTQGFYSRGMSSSLPLSVFCSKQGFYPRGLSLSLPLSVFSCLTQGFYSRGMSSSLPLSVFCSKQGFYPRGLSLSLPLSVFSCLTQGFYPKGMSSSLPLSVFSCLTQGSYPTGMSSSLPLCFSAWQNDYPKGSLLYLLGSVWSSPHHLLSSPSPCVAIISVLLLLCAVNVLHKTDCLSVPPSSQSHVLLHFTNIYLRAKLWIQLGKSALEFNKEKFLHSPYKMSDVITSSTGRCFFVFDIWAQLHDPHLRFVSLPNW